jgi:hypothetical protein
LLSSSSSPSSSTTPDLLFLGIIIIYTFVKTRWLVCFFWQWLDFWDPQKAPKSCGILMKVCSFWSFLRKQRIEGVGV